MKATSWPLVDKNDDGIRPAGRPDECFYCQRRVGQLHKKDCSIVRKRVELKLTVTMPDGRVITGVWLTDEPHFATPQQTEFMYNESSWCAGNILHDFRRREIALDCPDGWDTLEALRKTGDCLCNRTVVKFVRVVDDTPRRALREDPS